MVCPSPIMRILPFILLLVATFTSAEEQLPAQRPVSQYAKVWEDCPFNREVVKAVESQISSTFGKNIALDGLSHDSIIGPIAYLRNLSDNQPFMVTKEKSEAHPYQIVDATETNDPREAKVTITNGEEVAEISYMANLITQKIAQPTSKPAQPATAAGNAGARASNSSATTQPTAGNSATPSSATSGNTEAGTPTDTDRRRRILLPNRSQN